MKKLFLILAAAVVLPSCASVNLPPVTEERLNEMLAEIVKRESRIITEEESDKVIEKNKKCKSWHGCLLWVVRCLL